MEINYAILINGVLSLNNQDLLVVKYELTDLKETLFYIKDGDYKKEIEIIRNLNKEIDIQCIDESSLDKYSLLLFLSEPHKYDFIFKNKIIACILTNRNKKKIIDNIKLSIEKNIDHLISYIPKHEIIEINNENKIIEKNSKLFIYRIISNFGLYNQKYDKIKTGVILNKENKNSKYNFLRKIENIISDRLEIEVLQSDRLYESKILEKFKIFNRIFFIDFKLSEISITVEFLHQNGIKCFNNNEFDFILPENIIQNQFIHKFNENYNFWDNTKSIREISQSILTDFSTINFNNNSVNLSLSDILKFCIIKLHKIGDYSTLNNNLYLDLLEYNSIDNCYRIGNYEFLKLIFKADLKRNSTLMNLKFFDYLNSKYGKIDLIFLKNFFFFIINELSNTEENYFTSGIFLNKLYNYNKEIFFQSLLSFSQLSDKIKILNIDKKLIFIINNNISELNEILDYFNKFQSLSNYKNSFTLCLILEDNFQQSLNLESVDITKFDTNTYLNFQLTHFDKKYFNKDLVKKMGIKLYKSQKYDIYYNYILILFNLLKNHKFDTDPNTILKSFDFEESLKKSLSKSITITKFNHTFMLQCFLYASFISENKVNYTNFKLNKNGEYYSLNYVLKLICDLISPQSKETHCYKSFKSKDFIQNYLSCEFCLYDKIFFIVLLSNLLKFKTNDLYILLSFIYSKKSYYELFLKKVNKYSYNGLIGNNEVISFIRNVSEYYLRLFNKSSLLSLS